MEPLEKKCPRCGKASANPNNPQGRCSACLKKLRENKKKPGRYEHEHKLADDALRRQDGKTKQSKKKTSGRGSRKSIIKQVRRAYNEHGKNTTLSPDRKDNSKGYSASNTRMVPKKLNRGRHKVNPEKLKNWHKRLKKSSLSPKNLLTLMRAWAYNRGDEELAKALEINGLELIKAIINM